MNFSVISTEPFNRELKRLAKKYKSLKADITPVIKNLETNPSLGTPIGNHCYKIRVRIKSKAKGKSGGARIITFVQVIKNEVYLLKIYDKSEHSTISEKELKFYVELVKK